MLDVRHLLKSLGWVNKIAKDQPHGWQTVAPSTSTFSVHDAAPHALTIAEIKQIQQDFAAAVNVQLKRALS